jgi:predicted transcriptional regulator
MPDQRLPADVERFLFEELEDYEQLEALLYLHHDPARSASAREIAGALALAVDATLEALEHLRRRGLVVLEAGGGEPRYSYRREEVEGDTIRALARFYQERRVEVMKRMTANAIARVRSAAIRTFSDAFVLRRKRDDG